MPDPSSRENDFLGKVREIIEENISNEQFGVSELAREVGMSRSNLLRKIKKLSRLSVSQFISQVRLKNAMEILKQQSHTVSEVSYKVGFSSTSYFIKCFRELYGYSPGEVGKRLEEEVPVEKVIKPGRRKIFFAVGGAVIVILAILFIIVLGPDQKPKEDLEKSIAVLPFRNDSNDSSNIYIINGLMESLLDNLQKIEDLRVISRTSVEKYRLNPKTIPEIARELNANYLVEGSGQKIGSQILLNIQLIEASTDKHLWAKRYKREAGDIFELQLEVATNIVEGIEAFITPEEAEQIEKVPTQNLEAYDHFLRGMEPFQQWSREGLEEAIPHFQKAIELDPDFALAHADLSISYALLDIYRLEKKYEDLIDYHADRALLLDPKLPQSLIAKATFHNIRGEYKLALPYLEKALEYHPNSSRVINILADYYTRFVPNTEKYMEYALMGIELDIASHDSTEASYRYLTLSNALMQTGFVDEAEYYINKSLENDPDNLYSELLHIFILLARDGDLNQTRLLLAQAYDKDTSRLDILKELGVICYYQKDFESAFDYYSRLFNITLAQGLDMYEGEKAKMGLILDKLGRSEESAIYFHEYLSYAENDQSIYRGLSLAAYNAYQGDIALALRYMSEFAEQEKYPYWYILFLGMDDPLFEKLNENPEFLKILRQIELKFWKYHKEIKDTLKDKDLI